MSKAKQDAINEGNKYYMEIKQSQYIKHRINKWRIHSEKNQQ